MSFSSGDMKGESVPLPPLQPGKEFEVVIDLLAPDYEGKFSSFWKA